MATNTTATADTVEVAAILGIDPDDIQWMTHDEVSTALGKLQPQDAPALIS